MQILDPQTNILRIAAQSGFSNRFLEFFDEVRCKQGSCGTALLRGERVIVNDVRSDPIFHGTESGEVVLQEGVQAVQSIPLRTASGRWVGVLSTHFQAAKPSTARLLRVTDAFAVRVAELIHLKAAQLIERLGRFGHRIDGGSVRVVRQAAVQRDAG